MLEETEPYFVQRRNNIERLKLSFFQKMIATIRNFTYGVTTDFCDKYMRIGENIAMKMFKKQKKNC
jgi:hypothetical protein